MLIAARKDQPPATLPLLPLLAQATAARDNSRTRAAIGRKKVRLVKARRFGVAKAGRGAARKKNRRAGSFDSPVALTSDKLMNDRGGRRERKKRRQGERVADSQCQSLAASPRLPARRGRRGRAGAIFLSLRP